MRVKLILAAFLLSNLTFAFDIANVQSTQVSMISNPNVKGTPICKDSNLGLICKAKFPNKVYTIYADLKKSSTENKECIRIKANIDGVYTFDKLHSYIIEELECSALY